VHSRGQQGGVGNAGLDAVDGGVARPRIAEDEAVRQVAAEPRGRAVRRDVGQALGGPQTAVALDAAEAALVEEDAAVEILFRLEGEPGLAAEGREEARRRLVRPAGGGAEAADGAEVIGGE